MKTISLKKFTITHAVITLFTVGVNLEFFNQHLVSLFLGAITSYLSFLIMYVSFKNIFDKKHVALSVGLIVIKYAILGLLIYGIATSAEHSIVWFGVGICALFVSLTLYSLSLARS